MALFKMNGREWSVVAYRTFVGIAMIYLLMQFSCSCTPERMEIPVVECPTWTVTEVYTKDYPYVNDQTNTGFSGYMITGEETGIDFAEGYVRESCTEDRASYVMWRFIEYTDDKEKRVKEYIFIRTDLIK